MLSVGLSLRVEAILAGGEQTTALEGYFYRLKTVLVGCFLYGSLLTQLLLQFFLLLVHLVADESACAGTDSRPYSTADARTFTAADKSAEACTYGSAAATSYKGAFSGLSHRRASTFAYEHPCGKDSHTCCFK